MPGTEPPAPPSRRTLVFAAILSGLFPGLGQWYRGEKKKAALFAIGGVLTAFGPISPGNVDIDLGDPATGLRNVLLATLPFMIVATWSVIDAYRVGSPVA